MTPKARRWRGWITAAVIGALGTLAIAGGVSLVVILGGLFDATADTPHLSVVAWATHNAFKSSVSARAAQAQTPARFTQAQVLAGVGVYDRNCASCHGAPGVNRAPFARAMIPTPPYLLDAARRWNPQQLDWIVDHGIKMTAMPAWGEVLPREQVQDVVGFLTALPDLSAADYARLRTQATLASAPVSASAPPARSAATSRQVEAGRGD